MARAILVSEAVLSILRSVARPVAILAMLAFAAPAAVECREWSALSGAPLSCCLPHDEGATAVKTDCCAVQQDSRPDRPAGTAPAFRLDAAGLLTHVDLTAHAAPLPAVAPAFVAGGDPDVPPDRLYLRFSVIRR